MASNRREWRELPPKNLCFPPENPNANRLSGPSTADLGAAGWPLRLVGCYDWASALADAGVTPN
ncbi:hypothetical protein Pan181_48150 [Aeoliella mucimassa]|uniref:Uncharacterized protein n=1 Tax=Aeoliella mucimassa TaxID=2527972 RepID=A0A518AV33_9BACT|nr:hypothetical protein Pan181_48150 [Aeoliella mucimassa]